MAEIIQLRRELRCIACDIGYIDVPGPVLRHAGLERRANLCPACRCDGTHKDPAAKRLAEAQRIADRAKARHKRFTKVSDNA